MATASRPESHGKIEIESADDFILGSETHLDRASFTGLLFHGGPGEIRQVRVEIYRVLPERLGHHAPDSCAHPDELTVGRGV